MLDQASHGCWHTSPYKSHTLVTLSFRFKDTALGSDCFPGYTPLHDSHEQSLSQCWRGGRVLLGLRTPWPKSEPKLPYCRAEEPNGCFFTVTRDGRALGIGSWRDPGSHIPCLCPCPPCRNQCWVSCFRSYTNSWSLGINSLALLSRTELKPITSQEAHIMVFTSELVRRSGLCTAHTSLLGLMDLIPH